MARDDLGHGREQRRSVDDLADDRRRHDPPRREGAPHLPGARRARHERTPAQLDAIFAAASRPLTTAEVAALEALVPRDAIAGDRYAPAPMTHLDSER